MNATGRVALVTCARLADLDPDDVSLVSALERRGFAPEPVVWDDPAVAWRAYAAVVVRSTWDYHLRPKEFLRWIDAREAERSTLFNPPAVLRWNLDKATYLAELETRGVVLVPTVRLSAPPPGGLAALFADRDWDELVLKPALSADGFRTLRVRPANVAAGDALLSLILTHGQALVQPYRTEIESEGEWSFLYFGGRHSHTTRKRPAAGDFRVQDTYGGSRATVDAPAALRAQADRAAELAGGRELLYARVDGLYVGGRFEVMEVELIEPSLYFDGHAERAERFVDALEARLARASRL